MLAGNPLAKDKSGIFSRAKTGWKIFLAPFRSGTCEILKNRAWLWPRLAFSIVFAVELWGMQEATFALVYNPGLRFGLFARGIRFASDLLLIAAITCLLRRGCMILLALLAFALNVSLVTYYNYFRIPLSLSTLTYQWREGLDVARGAVAMIPPVAASLFGGALIAKIAIGLQARALLRPRRLGYVASLVLLGGYVSFQALYACFDPITSIRRNRTPGMYAMGRGYMELWAAQYLFLNNSSLRARAIDQTGKTSDRLTESEIGIQIGRRLIVIQIESLGYEAVNQKIDGQELMPFLDRLKNQSLFYRMRSPKRLGSADADFCMLTSMWPSPDCINYKIPNFPYDHTLPQFLKPLGFHTTCLMGDPGYTFSRRDAFPKMGFDDMLFKEEILARESVEIDEFGVRDPDLLRLSSMRLREGHLDPKHSSDRTFQFIVTTTTHLPWNTLRDGEKQIFPESKNDGENFCNACRFIDNNLRDYIAGLPADTTVVIYGDHTSSVNFRTIHADWTGIVHYVPCWIFNLGEDLGSQQRTRKTPAALDGTFTLLDLANYLRSQSARTFDGARR